METIMEEPIIEEQDDDEPRSQSKMWETSCLLALLVLIAILAWDRATLLKHHARIAHRNKALREKLIKMQESLDQDEVLLARYHHNGIIELNSRLVGGFL